MVVIMMLVCLYSYGNWNDGTLKTKTKTKEKRILIGYYENITFDMYILSILNMKTYIYLVVRACNKLTILNTEKL